jgi:IMP dehydrogenase
LLLPQYSEVTPSEINTSSFFARNVFLKVPVIAAAMDTVTEHKTARVMAQIGGLGILHKNMSIANQALEVERVKKYESGMILDPITMHPENRVSDAMKLMQRYSIPVYQSRWMENWLES